MDALKQYLDLYLDHKDLLCGKSAPGFNRLREEALRNLELTGLPKKGSENYELTDIPAMLTPDYGLNIARVPLEVNVAEGFRCGLPHLSSALFFLLNDSFAEARGARHNLPEGVEIGPLSCYMKDGGEAEKIYGTIADLANPIVALNTLLAQEGIYIKVRKGVKVEKPLQIVNILENTLPLMAVRRVLIELEEDSELKILSCDHTSSPHLEMAAIDVVEIKVGRRARLDYYDMEESGDNTRRLSALYLYQEMESDVQIASLTLHNGLTRNEFHCSFKGKSATLRLCGFGIESRGNLIDNYSHIRHEAQDCHTDELFKYVVEDESRGAFTGRIYVAPGACFTEAYQSNRNLVSSDKARIFSKPQLEIYNDEVKCSHGSATGQLDAMQLFYMRSRGLSDEEARLLLKQAFMADVIDGVRLSMLRDRLHTLIERRFTGHDTSCGECEICK